MLAADVLTIPEAAATLRVSSRTIRRYLGAGTLVARRISRNTVRVDASSVMRLLAGSSAAGVPIMARNPSTPPGQSGPSRPWQVYFEKKRGYVIKYRDAAGTRRTHRVPSSAGVTSTDQAESYAIEWFRGAAVEDASVGARGNGKERERSSTSPRARARFVTFEAFGTMWTGGALAKQYPDHVSSKKSSKDDAGRLALHVYPVVGQRPIADFEGEDGVLLAEQVMDGLPETLSAGTRRHVAQAMSRILTLAAYPARLLSANPLPKGFVPKARGARAKSILFPEEDARLMACTDVPLLERLFYGLLAREGLRVSELLELRWRDVDLDHGTLQLDENKTDDPRSWALDAGVVEALRRWKMIVPCNARSVVLKDVKGRTIEKLTAARRLRHYLEQAGVTREQLFEDSDSRMPLRAHDLRGTFVTVSLALGKTETWVMDRTGHRSSQMINLYRRRARTGAETKLGPLSPLHEAIPELGG